MKVSIFTPTHDPKYLPEIWEELKDQPFYEWVIVAQNCQIPDFKDERVKAIQLPLLGEHYVGSLKRFACQMCTGDILLELDHDDILLPGAVEAVQREFEDEEIGFVYSNFANFQGDFEKVERYSESYGWQYRPFTYRGHELDEVISFDPTASALSRIWFAPNHLRAWRTSVYNALGGHKDMKVMDDGELLIRTFLATKMKRIDECLYLYRINDGNTWKKNQDEIQRITMELYHESIRDLAIREAQLKGLLSLDLGGRFNSHPKCQSVDLKNADIIADLNDPWMWEDNSVGVIIANDIFEHLTDKLHVIKEAYRVLAPGGYLFVRVPSTDGRGAFQDPTHVSFYNENSFLYYVDNQWAKYIDTPVRFQSMRLFTTEKDSNQVCWVEGHFVALKGNRPPGGIKI